LELLLIILYGLALLFIFSYSIVQINLVINYIKSKKNEKAKLDILDITDINKIPHVTIQLPIYNELYVTNRLIDAVASLNYPTEKLEVQILDDSTDETVELITEKVKEWEQKGINIIHFRRENRDGYKAGALAEGLKSCKGEFVAIFDADFVPDKNFLIHTIPHFKDSSVGVVQTKWEHLNKDYSLLTKLQAFGLDAHFSIEQRGRNYGGHFINFNGTAGIWRKKCIVDAGGWQADTLTEDLDLSYRAQLKKWKFIYLENVGSPSELPAAMNALKTQQYRWTKGAAECTKKLLRNVLKSEHLTFKTKVHAIFHLMNSSVFLTIIFTALASMPILFIKNNTSEYNHLFQYAAVFLFSLVFLAIFYFVSSVGNKKIRLVDILLFMFYFPLFLSVSMGLSLHNAIAVIEGYIGKKSAFIRTPKFNIITKTDKWEGNKYLVSNISLLTIFEALLCIYFLVGIFYAFKFHDFGLLPFHIMLAFGFGYVTYSSVYHSKISVKKI